MRVKIFIIIFLFLRFSSYAQIHIIDSFYTKFDGTLRQCYIIVGQNTVLNIDKSEISASQLRDSATLLSIRNRCDSIYNFFKTNLGFEPPGGNPNYAFKCNIYFGNPSCGAGCGLVGAKGIEVSGFSTFYGSVKYRTNNSPVIVPYELGRNFFTFTNKVLFPFTPGTPEKNGGWAEAFAQLFASKSFDYCLSASSERIFNETIKNLYWGRKNFIGYINDTLSNPYNTFARWDVTGIRDMNRGIDDGNNDNPSWSTFGILCGIIHTFGDDQIFPHFFNYLRQSPNVSSINDALSNVALSTSRAVNKNLLPFFKNVLKFNINSTIEAVISQLPTPINKLIKYEDILWFATPFETVRVNLRSLNYLAENEKYRVTINNNFYSESRSGNNEIPYSVLGNSDSVIMKCYLLDSINRPIDSFKTILKKRHNINLLRYPEEIYAYYTANKYSSSTLHYDTLRIEKTDSLEDHGLVRFNLSVNPNRQIKVSAFVRRTGLYANYQLPFVTNFGSLGFGSTRRSSGSPRVGWDVAPNDTLNYFLISGQDSTQLFIPTSTNRCMLKLDVSSLASGPQRLFVYNWIYRDETDVDSDGLIDFEDPCPHYPNPISSFTFLQPSMQCISGNNFSFTNTSSIRSGSMTHLWSFGDGGTATTLNATRSYTTPGTYTVKLVSTSNNGCKDSTTQQVVVNPMPASGYTINSIAQCLTGNSFSFANTASISSGTLTHAWSFGDGGTATTLNATRSYAAPGTYAVKLVSTSNNGCKDSTTQQVVVNPMPAAGYTINSNAQCLTGNSFGFTNTSSITTGSLTQHSWSFGDGGTATTLNATRSYAAPGTYTVKLVSNSNNGCKDSITQQVVVNPMPSTAFSINSAGQCLSGNSFTFTNNSVITTGSLTQHSRNFGDGGTATTLNATRSYSTPGTYTVKLVSTSNNGCKDSTTRSVTVHPMPLSIFSANTAIQCLTGNTFQFSNNSMISSGTLSSNWSFGNGATSTLQSPTHSYAAVGSYTVKLVSTSNNGCKDSTTRDMRVDPSPTATLSVGPYRSIHPGLLTAISATITPAGNYQYTWYRNNTAIPNETTTVVDSIGYRLWSGAYKMAVANTTPLLPCTYTTPEVVIGDSASARLFIYPSPNTGQFKVTYYSAANTRYQIVITDTKGAVLYRRQHEVTNRYQLIDINLTGASRGLYLLQVQDPSGVPLTSGKFVIH